MGQILISYASEDAGFARRLTGELEGEGWTVWWDKQIPPGMDYARVTENAVNAAQCVVVLWSRHSIGSRWVHTEAAAGADRNIVATVIIDDSPNEDIPFEFSLDVAPVSREPAQCAAVEAPVWSDQTAWSGLTRKPRSGEAQGSAEQSDSCSYHLSESQVSASEQPPESR